MASSNERTLVMFDAVGAGLVECIRLAQADIHESAKQQQRQHQQQLQQQQMTTRHQPYMVRQHHDRHHHHQQQQIQQNLYHPYNPSYNHPATTQINGNHPMIQYCKSTPTNTNAITPISPYDHDDHPHHQASVIPIYPAAAAVAPNYHGQQQAQQHQMHDYYGDTNIINDSNKFIDLKNDLKNSFSSSSTSTTSFSTNNNSSNTNLNNSNNINHHDSASTDTRLSRGNKNARAKSFNHYLMHHISGTSPILDDIICMQQQQQQLIQRKHQSNHHRQYSSDQDDHSATSSASSSSCDIDQQSREALKYAQQLEAKLIRLDDLRDRYVLHLKMGQGAKTISRAYALSSASLSSASLGKLTSSRAQLASALSNGTINSKIVKASIKDFMENIDKIETELESIMGTFMLQIKSIQGFARICSGDVFEITIKYGDKQKFKTKIRVLKGDRQKCDHKEAIFKARINDVLSVKASECKGLGKKSLLGNKLCETKDLFTAHSQLMTISLNQTGSIKLNLVVTWNPLDISASNTISNVNRIPSFTNK